MIRSFMLAAALSVGTVSFAQDKPSTPAVFVKAGEQAPNFILEDIEGDKHDLRALIQDEKKIVVIEWFDPLNPSSRSYHDQRQLLEATRDQFEDKDVVWFAVASFGIAASETPAANVAGKLAPAEAPCDTNHDTTSLATMNREQATALLLTAKDELDIEYPVLLDDGGHLAKLYGVRSVPHIYIVNKGGAVAYHGSIDSSRGVQQPTDLNYLAQALTELTNDQAVSVPHGVPSGTTLPASAPRLSNAPASDASKAPPK